MNTSENHTAFKEGNKVRVKLETIGSWNKPKMKKLILDQRPATITSVINPDNYTKSQIAYDCLIHFDSVGKERSHTCRVFKEDIELISAK